MCSSRYWLATPAVEVSSSRRSDGPRGTPEAHPYRPALSSPCRRCRTAALALTIPCWLGVPYLGNPSVAADIYSGFRSNFATLPIEVNALFHVRNIQGARRIAAT